MEASESTRALDDLTSTMESVLTNNGHEKKISRNDSVSIGDSTPSSSSDANMQSSVIKTIQDDPISSTSDTITNVNEMNLNILTPDLNFIVGVETSGSTNELGADTDFFSSELNMESMSTEKISEDVEDIANDLENLLGETTHNYGVICSNSEIPFKSTEIQKTVNTSSINLENLLDQNVSSIHDKKKSNVSENTEHLDKKDISEIDEKTDISLKSKTYSATCVSETQVTEIQTTASIVKSDKDDVAGNKCMLEKDSINEEGQNVQENVSSVSGANEENINDLSTQEIKYHKKFTAYDVENTASEYQEVQDSQKPDLCKNDDINKLTTQEEMTNVVICLNVEQDIENVTENYPETTENSEIHTNDIEKDNLIAASTLSQEKLEKCVQVENNSLEFKTKDLIEVVPETEFTLSNKQLEKSDNLNFDHPETEILTTHENQDIKESMVLEHEIVEENPESSAMNAKFETETTNLQNDNKLDDSLSSLKESNKIEKVINETTSLCDQVTEDIISVEEESECTLDYKELKVDGNVEKVLDLPKNKRTENEVQIASVIDENQVTITEINNSDRETLNAIKEKDCRTNEFICENANNESSQKVVIELSKNTETNQDINIESPDSNDKNIELEYTNEFKSNDSFEETSICKYADKNQEKKENNLEIVETNDEVKTYCKDKTSSDSNNEGATDDKVQSKEINLSPVNIFSDKTNKLNEFEMTTESEFELVPENEIHLVQQEIKNINNEEINIVSEKLSESKLFKNNLNSLEGCDHSEDVSEMNRDNTENIPKFPEEKEMSCESNECAESIEMNKENAQTITDLEETEISVIPEAKDNLQQTTTDNLISEEQKENMKEVGLHYNQMKSYGDIDNVKNVADILPTITGMSLDCNKQVEEKDTNILKQNDIVCHEDLQHMKIKQPEIDIECKNEELITIEISKSENLQFDNIDQKTLQGTTLFQTEVKCSGNSNIDNTAVQNYFQRDLQDEIGETLVQDVQHVAKENYGLEESDTEKIQKHEIKIPSSDIICHVDLEKENTPYVEEESQKGEKIDNTEHKNLENSQKNDEVQNRNELADEVDTLNNSNAKLCEKEQLDTENIDDANYIRKSVEQISKDAHFVPDFDNNSSLEIHLVKESDTPSVSDIIQQEKSEIQNSDLLQSQFNEESDVSNETSEIQSAISKIVNSSDTMDDSKEETYLQNTVSQIIGSFEAVSDSKLLDNASETIDDSERLELQSAISQITNTSEIENDDKTSDLQCTTQTIDVSEIADNSKSSDIQCSISQITDSPDTTDNSKISHFQSVNSQNMNLSDSIDNSNTSELQTAISHIISAETEADSKENEIFALQTVNIQKTDVENFQNQVDDTLPSEQVVGMTSSDSNKNDSVFEEIHKETQVEEVKETENAVRQHESKSEENEEKSISEGVIESIYSQPVVDLMLEDMDDQLKNVIFESKSGDPMVNIPNLGEVDLDTPKTFESQHMDLILPEETSLLNTDDIISGIASRNQNIAEFTHEVDLKLQEQGITGSELKIEELHGNETKDLNDVIAREIESLLKLQTQNLTTDPSTIDSVGEDITDKIESRADEFVLEQKIAETTTLGENKCQCSDVSDNKLTVATTSRENVFRQSSISDDTVGKGVLEENVFRHSSISDQISDRIQHDFEFIKKGSDEEISMQFLPQKSSATISSQEIDSLMTSTESIEFSSTKELNRPLIIEVGTPTINVDVKEPLCQSEIVEVPTSKYSSKMSENEDLKMTITKHKTELSVKMSESLKTEDTHSILKIYDPKDTVDYKKASKSKETTVPKLIIKPIIRSQMSPTQAVKYVEEGEQTVPKLFIKNMSPNRPGSPKVSKAQKSEITSPLKLTIKPVLKSEDNQSRSSPKLTIKPVIKNEEDLSPSGPKITIKPIVKPLEEESCHSPKITIKPVVKPDECQSDMMHSPRITIKPIPKPDEIKEFSTSEAQSPRITIKAVIKPDGHDSLEQELFFKKSSDLDSTDRSHSPRITIKPIVKPEDHKLSGKPDQKIKQDDIIRHDKKEGSPKITIKPIMKPVENESDSVELIDFEEQIKQERIVLKINKTSMSKDTRKRDSTEEIEKLAKIKLKFSKEGGHAHIVSEQSKLKRALEESIDFDQKRTKFETGDLTIIPIDADAKKCEKIIEIAKDDVNITPIDTGVRSVFEDPLEKIPVFEITPESAVMMKNTVGSTTVQQVPAPAPRKRGRPRKVPLVVREEFKDIKEETQQEQPQPTPEETGRPKRSCRGPSVRTTLGIRTRKPRGSGRGRGRGRGSRGVGSRGGRQQRVSAAKLKLLKEEAAAAIAEQSKSLEPEDGGDAEMKEELAVENVTTETTQIVLIEEETRMSADINTSRAQTPAKQIPTPGDVDDTQSSVHSTATTESAKARKGTRLEVHQEPEGEVISADQLTEYYWGGGGPYMLQEQVAQFLGIKSFKRKYPGIQRRTVDMQERDFIRESGLVSEAMCDLGLTAVHSTDILDIMYSDFQHKYEEYCKHQRDRQAKDFSNKQKALSLAASQEKNKHDIMQQAVQSAASWNANFNKSRKEERKACMDLQTFTVHYPKGKFKTVERNKVGHYPVALVPGQYTDYYKTFTSTELSNLPLNTMLNKPLNIPLDDDSQSDGSGSDSDSSSSDSDSSSSDSSDEDCNVCSPTSSNQTKKVLAN